MRTSISDITNIVPGDATENMGRTTDVDSAPETPEATEESGAYTIRIFDPGDKVSFLSLYESVWGRERTEAWFDWKYGVDNPFYDETPVLVAETDGEIVGAKPHVPAELRIDDRTVVGLIGTDTMVHEDHRQQGLFSRLTDRSVDRYADREPVVTFNFPNDKSKPGYRKRGWYFLGNRNTSAYRIHDLKPYVRHSLDRFGRPAAYVSGAITRGGYALLDALREPTDDVTVEVNPSDPISELGGIEPRDGTPRFHVDRSERFYDWWLKRSDFGDHGSGGDSLREESYHVAYDGDDAVAGAVSVTYDLTEPIFDGYVTYGTITNVVDVIPVASETRVDAVSAVLESVVRESRRARYVRVPENALPEDLARTFGFISQTHPQLSSVTDLSGPLALSPLGEAFAVDGAALTDSENWIITNAEYR